jgi:hypothetical protein
MIFSLSKKKNRKKEEGCVGSKTQNVTKDSKVQKDRVNGEIHGSHYS